MANVQGCSAAIWDFLEGPSAFGLRYRRRAQRRASRQQRLTHSATIGHGCCGQVSCSDAVTWLRPKQGSQTPPNSRSCSHEN